MKVGLTLGKFAPFHRGHQYLIDTALCECDHVRVIIYDCPETTEVPLSVRANWIRAIYPQVDVIEAWNGPTETGNTPEIKKAQEDYIIETLGIRNIFRFYSSEWYGEHVSVALNCENRIVDPPRVAVPICGEQVRPDPFARRDWLHPRVLRDYVVNAVFLGAPSTGKTTLSSHLAREFHTEWMPEYGREYWDLHNVNRRLTLAQLEEIAVGHLQREEELLQRANRILFTDTNALTTRMFSYYYNGGATPGLEELANRCSARYDVVFFCEDDIPYEDDPDRSGEANRTEFQKRIRADLLVRNIPFFTLHGDLETRAREAKAVLARVRKWTNWLGA